MPQLIIPKQPAKSSPVVERLTVSAKEAAEMLSVSERTVRVWANQGKLETRRIGGRVLYPLESLRRLINGEGGES